LNEKQSEEEDIQECYGSMNNHKDEDVKTMLLPLMFKKSLLAWSYSIRISWVTQGLPFTTAVS
jgi:hypothetical protein